MHLAFLVKVVIPSIWELIHCIFPAYTLHGSDYFPWKYGLSVLYGTADWASRLRRQDPKILKNLSLFCLVPGLEQTVCWRRGGKNVLVSWKVTATEWLFYSLYSTRPWRSGTFDWGIASVELMILNGLILSSSLNPRLSDDWIVCSFTYKPQNQTSTNCFAQRSGKVNCQCKS